MNGLQIKEEARPVRRPKEREPIVAYQEETGKASRARRRSDRKSILLVEDEPLNRQVISRFLGILGYRIFQSDRGDEGLALALEEDPDLLILDNQLPGLNGLEIVARLRKERRATPAVLMSAYELSPADRKRMQALQVCGFLRKPFSFPHLKTVIHFAVKKPRFGFRRGKMYYCQPYFSLTSRALARQVFKTVFRTGLDLAGHVHFYVNNHSDHLVLLCSRDHLGKVIAKSKECGPGEYIPWDRSSFRGYNRDKALKELNQEINLVLLDVADYQMSWPTLADFICWIKFSY